jgi:hypothetical protein
MSTKRIINTDKDKLKGFKKVKQSEICNIKAGDFIKYSVDKKLRNGGLMHQNHHPKYLVLANYRIPTTWCVQLNEPSLKLYIKKKEVFDEKRKEKNEIYRKYKEGKLTELN